MAKVPDPVRDVLDALAMAEPLEAEILSAVASPAALDEAESLGLVTVDSSVEPASARLAHPLLGEVSRTGSLRKRRLRARIAAELARRASTDPRDLVKRAVLTLDSDVTPDTELLIAAASAAMQFGDLRLAEALSAHGADSGAGVPAKFIQAMAITWQERGTDAEAVLAGLAGETDGPIRAQVAILRAMNFALSLGDAASAERELDIATAADSEAAQEITDALRAMIDLVSGHSAAVDRASTILAGEPANGIARMMSIWVLVSGLGDLGRLDDIAAAAEEGYRLAETSAEASHLRLPLAAVQGIAYRLCGDLAALDALIARIRNDTIDVPFQQAWHGFFAGLAAMSRGDLAAALRSLQETLALLANSGGGRMTVSFTRSWLAAVLAMMGRTEDARRELGADDSSSRNDGSGVWDLERIMAEAWTSASEGATSQGILLVRDAAEKEARRGRPAWEVVLLQTATRFGDRTTAGRLRELQGRVQGPRASVAASHADALAAGNGDGLVDASRRYEEFGDRMAALDAAAQAVAAYQQSGRRGSALNVSARVERLAAECHGADTPALRAARTPQAFTERQREIISAAAQGLSNKEIADRFTMSVRSVEGHLFRASQRVGANSREELISILRGS